MGTLELCPTWDIYGERWNLSQENVLREFCFSDRSIPKIVTNVTPNVTSVHFQWGKWIMNYGIFRLRPTLRAFPSRISKQEQKQACTSHTECVTNLWHLRPSQTVTNLNLWPNLFVWFLFSFFSKTSLVTLWSKCHKWSNLQLWLVQTCFCFCFDWNGSESTK